MLHFITRLRYISLSTNYYPATICFLFIYLKENQQLWPQLAKTETFDLDL